MGQGIPDLNDPRGKVWQHPAPFMGDVGLRLPGTYLLVFALGQETNLAVGRIGVLCFASGWYAYVGSAMGGLAVRIRHHLRTHQHPRWHIDYLLAHSAPAVVIVGRATRPLECLVAGALAQRLQVVRRFGSSDCRCPGHLFHNKGQRAILVAALEALRGLGSVPRKYYLDARELNGANALF